MRILAISGSLQAGSADTALLRAAAAVAPADVQVDVYDALAELPHFNPDLDTEPGPAAVARLRARLAAADAVLIATPEYAHGLPGALKNALDWVVSSGELYGKAAAILSAAPARERGAYARESLARTLEAEGARVVVSETIELARQQDPLEERPRSALATALATLVAHAAAP